MMGGVINESSRGGERIDLLVQGDVALHWDEREESEEVPACTPERRFLRFVYIDDARP